MITCGKCSTQNPQGSKFCKKCGADLSIWKPGSTAPTPTSAAPPTPASASGKVSAADLQAAQQAATRFEGEARDLRDRLALSEQQVQKLQRDLAAAPNAPAFAKAQSDLASANLRIQQLGQEINAKVAEITRLNQSLQQQGGTSADLAQALRDLTGARDQVSALSAQIAQISSDLATVRQDATRFERQWRDSAAEVTRLRGVERTLSDRNRDLEAEVQQLSTRGQFDWRSFMQQNQRYLIYGGLSAGGLIVFTIISFIFGFTVSLPLALLAGQLTVIYKADWALGNQGPTIIGWAVLMGPAALLTAGMWIQIGGAPVVSWPVMNLYALVLPAAVFARARK